MNVIAISRGTQYSPNHVGNDAAIYNKVIEELLGMGHTVERYTEETFCRAMCSEQPDLVVSMARDSHTLDKLKEWERKGVIIVNPPHGVLNCVRRPMTELLVEQGVPHPQSWILSTDAVLPEQLTFPCWLKRGDSHALVKEDVCFATTRDEAARVVGGMRQRGIPTVVINEHLVGDLVKFYGVQGDPFFHWFYPSLSTHSKFGLEAVNGEAEGIPFEVEALKQMADEAARVLRVPVYGGDAIVGADGRVCIIDFNDWPSFAPCRDEAARAIARRAARI